jgi:hypothetical protein
MAVRIALASAARRAQAPPTDAAEVPAPSPNAAFRRAYDVRRNSVEARGRREGAVEMSRSGGRRWLLAAVLLVTLGGCGGSTASSSQKAPSTKSVAPPGAQVSAAVASVVQTCITHSFNPATTSIGPVTEAVGLLVGYAHRYSMTAEMSGSTIKAKTLRDALSNLLPDLQSCSPADATRADDALSAGAG